MSSWLVGSACPGCQERCRSARASRYLKTPPASGFTSLIIKYSLYFGDFSQPSAESFKIAITQSEFKPYLS